MKPRILLCDIETAPILGYVWKLWDQNVSVNQIHSDWYVLSWCAKWLDDPPKDVMYMDQRKSKPMENDSRILKELWKLLDEADIVVWQNGKNFDHKKLNARFVIHGMQPPSSYRHIDTKLLAKKHFGFTSNRLEYLSEKLNKKYKKQKHKAFAGFELWKECLAGNPKAWKEMEKYNKYDVLSLEELYKKLIPWDNSVNFNVYQDKTTSLVCTCGSTEFTRRGYYYTATAKYQKHRCKNCGSELRSRLNEIGDSKQLVGTTR